MYNGQYLCLNKTLDKIMDNISTSNRMFERTIWDKLPECIFENFEITRVKPE